MYGNEIPLGLHHCTEHDLNSDEHVLFLKLSDGAAGEVPATSKKAASL